MSYMRVKDLVRDLVPWEYETHEERARRVCAEADRLQAEWDLRQQWRAELTPAPSEALPTPIERPWPRRLARAV